MFTVIVPEVVDDTTLVSTTATDATVAYAGGTTYAAGDVVAYLHRKWESLQAANIGHTPGDDASSTWWADAGPTNDRAMFDLSNGTQTTRADSLTVQVKFAGTLVQSVVLDNINAATVRVKMTDDVEGVVYDETVDLVSDSGVGDYYDWCFLAPVRATYANFVDLRPYPGATFEVTLAATGETVACGFCGFGYGQEIGGTLWGANVGFEDYSVKSRNEFGDFDQIVERGWAKVGDFDIQIAEDDVDEVQRIFVENRASPIVIIGDGDFGVTQMVGFVKNFTQELREAGFAYGSLSFEGLT